MSPQMIIDEEKIEIKESEKKKKKEKKSQTSTEKITETTTEDEVIKDVTNGLPAQAKPEKKGPFSWKNLGRVALIGLAGVGACAALSTIGMIAAIPTAGVVAMSSILGTVSAISAGVAVAGVAAMGVKGLVNGVKFLFNKNYRQQVLSRRKTKTKTVEKTKTEEYEREEEQEKNKEEKKEKKTVREVDPEPKPQPELTDQEIFKRIQAKSLYGANLSAREWIALQQIYYAEKVNVDKQVKALEKIENPTPDQLTQLEALKLQQAKITKLEKGAYKAAKERAAGEAADMNNSISDEERKIFKDYAEKGKKSTEVKKLQITDEDRRRAQLGADVLDRKFEEKKKSSGR